MIASESLPQDFNVATWFVDRNVAEGRGARPAFSYLGEPSQGRVLTYSDVQDLANRTGNALRELGDEELVTNLREAKEELFNLRFQVATGQLDNNRRLQTVRRDIARIYTVMRERELGIVRTGGAA